MTTRMMNGYSYNPIDNTLTVTTSFLHAASKLGSPAYEIIKKLRNENPGMKIEEHKRTPSSKGNRPVTAKYADMEHFIKQFPKEQQKSLMERYNKVKALSKTHRSPYKFVLDWFLDYFPLYNSDAAFDEKGNLTILKTKDDLEQEKLQAELKNAVEVIKEISDNDYDEVAA